MKWDATTKTFSTSDGGFYSHWFGKDQFVELLTRWFSIMDMKEVGKQGMITRINANNRKNGNVFIRSNQPPQIFLLCPICSSKLIPNTDKRLIVCQCCSNRFPINDIQGFKVPILLTESR
ncbi:MAG: hypothetical protein LBE76_05820 [Nitrososphaerota archaeon]|nr:hypothetical protein [Nitrososphaerota archaeon]